MIDEKVPCSLHPQLMEWIKTVSESLAGHEVHIKTSLKNQDEIFERLREIQSTLDKRINLPTQIEHLSVIAEDNQKQIEKLTGIVSNGLSDRTKKIEETVELLKNSVSNMKHTQELEDAKSQAGLEGYLKVSWEQFKKISGPAIIGIILWLLAWGAVKSLVFKEYPFPYPITKQHYTTNKS
jgi:vacuolar-type H+-ATPase subunit I/STV1